MRVQWAAVMAVDAFAAFEEVEQSEAAAVGARFRDTVLGMGGARHPAQVFKDFRGRDVSIEPLLQLYGLDK